MHSMLEDIPILYEIVSKKRRKNRRKKDMQKFEVGKKYMGYEKNIH